jgi:hypothetical protein
MTVRCPNCSELNLPDPDGRRKPWCSSCGAGLADTGERVQSEPAPVPYGTEPAPRPSQGAGVSAGVQRRNAVRKPDSPWAFMLGGLALVGLGVAVVVSTLGDTIEGLLSRSWPKTQGTVVQSRVEEWLSNKGSRSFTLVANYRYEVAGKRYESSNIQFCRQLHAGDRARGEEELAKIAPAGKPCVVYYDPSDPARSCLVPGASLFYLVFLPLLAVFFLLVGGICAWSSARRIVAGEKTALAVKAALTW